MTRIEDLYEVPPAEIELIGGYYDGRRMPVLDNRDTWWLPVPPGWSLLDPEPDVTRPQSKVAAYRWTGSVRDDGTRVFQIVK